MNPQKVEKLLHQFFANACLNLDVYDSDGKRHMPREWFIAPLAVIERAVSKIADGSIVEYQYDPKAQEIRRN